jgi:hypothetical protein
MILNTNEIHVSRYYSIPISYILTLEGEGEREREKTARLGEMEIVSINRIQLLETKILK